MTPFYVLLHHDEMNINQATKHTNELISINNFVSQLNNFCPCMY